MDEGLVAEDEGGVGEALVFFFVFRKERREKRRVSFFFGFGGNGDDDGDDGGGDIRSFSRSNPPLSVLISHTSRFGSIVCI